MTTPTVVTTDPDPNEARIFYGKSIDLKYDNYFLENGRPSSASQLSTVSVTGPWGGGVNKTFRCHWVRQGKMVTVFAKPLAATPPAAVTVAARAQSALFTAPVGMRPIAVVGSGLIQRYKVANSMLINNAGDMAEYWVNISENGNMIFEVTRLNYAAFAIVAGATGWNADETVMFQYLVPFGLADY